MYSQSLAHIVITKHHHIIKTRGHTHAQIRHRSQNGGQNQLRRLDLCFASSPSYHYSLKCQKVQYQALQDKCQWSSNIMYLRRLRTQTEPSAYALGLITDYTQYCRHYMYSTSINEYAILQFITICIWFIIIVVKTILALAVLRGRWVIQTTEQNRSADNQITTNIRTNTCTVHVVCQFLITKLRHKISAGIDII